MTEVTVSGNTREEALAEGLKQLGVGEDAVDVEVLSETHDDTLPGAEPLPGTTLRLRVKGDVVARRAKDHLRAILDLIGIKAHIETLNRSRGLTLNILAGEDGALVIGKNGQTLDALQHLVNRMVVRGAREYTAVLIDSESYRDKRMSKLEDLAKRMAQKAVRTKQEVVLEPMSAGDRKIIHLTLKDMRGVHTISRGFEAERRVAICPVGADLARERPRMPRRSSATEDESLNAGHGNDAQVFDEDDDNRGNR